MELFSKPPREVSGPDTDSRFSYQKNWAIYTILQEFEKNTPFLFLLDCHEDIVLIDNVNAPTQATFYQIKTKKGKNWTFSGTHPALLNLWHYLHTLTNKQEAKSFNFVTNSYFTEKEINHCLETQASFPLTQLPSAKLKLLKKKISQKYPDLDCELCIENTYIYKAAMDIDTSRETVIGFLSNFLEKHCPKTHLGPAALYRWLFDEVTKKGNAIPKVQTFCKIQELKGISFQDIKRIIDSIPQVKPSLQFWATIENQLTKLNISETKKYILRNAYSSLFIDKIVQEEQIAADYKHCTNIIQDLLPKLQNNENLLEIMKLIKEDFTKTHPHMIYSPEELEALILGAYYGEFK